MGGGQRALNPNLVFVTLIVLVILLVLGWFAWPTRYAYSSQGFVRRDRFTGCIEVYRLRAPNSSLPAGWVGGAGCKAGSSTSSGVNLGPPAARVHH